LFRIVERLNNCSFADIMTHKAPGEKVFKLQNLLNVYVWYLYRKFSSTFEKSFLLFQLNDPCVSGVVLKELGQNSNFSVKSKVLRRRLPLLYPE